MVPMRAALCLAAVALLASGAGCFPEPASEPVPEATPKKAKGKSAKRPKPPAEKACR